MSLHRLPLGTIFPEMIGALFTFALLTSPAFAAESCGEVRLDRTSLRAVAVQDQQGIDNCYAFAVAQAADAWRYSHGDNRSWRQTSPTHLSVMYAFEEKLLPLEVKKDFGGMPFEEAMFRMSRASMNQGSPKAAFDKLRKYGSCDLKGFISHRDQLLIEAIWLHLRRLTTIADLERRPVSPDEVQCFKEGLSPFQNAGHLVRAFTGAMDKKYPLAIMKDATERICRGRTLPMRHLPETKGTDVATDSPAERLRLIHAALDQDRPQPPVVSYCARMLGDRDAKATEKLGMKDQPCGDRPGKFDGHVSVVVGRRKTEAGKCQLLIRNSWGYACENRLDGRKPYAWDCEAGQIWVDEEALANNAYWVSYLPGQPVPQP